jgi:5'-3' exonuclease
MIALLDSDIFLYEIGYTTEEEPDWVAFARMDEKIFDIMRATKADEYQCYLSDSKENNFRYKVDPSYKANRTQPKPKHYEILKEYLIVEHGAKIAHGMEADDAIALEQTRLRKEAGLICSKLATGVK